MENFWIFLLVIFFSIYNYRRKKNKKEGKQKKKSPSLQEMIDLIEEQDEDAVKEEPVALSSEFVLDKNKKAYEWRDGISNEEDENKKIIKSKKQIRLKNNHKKNKRKQINFNLRQAVIYSEILNKKY